MKHFKKVLIPLLCAALFLSGCTSVSEIGDEEFLPGQSDGSSSQSASAEQPAVLPEELALPYYPELSLDPITCPDGVQQTVAALLCEGLFELDEPLRLSLCSVPLIPPIPPEPFIPSLFDPVPFFPTAPPSRRPMWLPHCGAPSPRDGMAHA